MGGVGRPTHRRLVLETDHVFVGLRQVGDEALLCFWDDEDRTLARIHPSAGGTLRSAAIDLLAHRPWDEWNVIDDEGIVFRLRRYEAGDHPSYIVVDDNDEPLGTFFCEGGALHEEIVVRDEAAAPVAELSTRHHVHELRELHGSGLASCRRVVDRYGDDPLQEVWELHIESNDDLVDRRVLLAAPMVSALTSHPKRHLDPSCAVAGALLLTVPPAGLALLLFEECLDGWYWIRRKLQ
jgi:hypothetical protein